MFEMKEGNNYFVEKYFSEMYLIANVDGRLCNDCKNFFLIICDVDKQSSISEIFRE